MHLLLSHCKLSANNVLPNTQGLCVTCSYHCLQNLKLFRISENLTPSSIPVFFSSTAKKGLETIYCTRETHLHLLYHRILVANKSYEAFAFFSTSLLQTIEILITDKTLRTINSAMIKLCEREPLISIF